MAVKAEETAVAEVEKRDTKVKALINLKYDCDVVKIGSEFSIRSTESEDLVKLGYVEIVK